MIISSFIAMKNANDNETEDMDVDEEPLAQVAQSKNAKNKKNTPSKSKNQPAAAENKQPTEDPDEEMDHILDDEEGGIRIGDIYIPPAPKPTLSMEAVGPRLIISKIVNHNFKRYAGTQVLGPFHKVRHL